jgi:uncharacterized phage protein gp47/JayE
MPIFTTPSQSSINRNLSSNIQTGLGSTYNASDATHRIISNAVSTSIGDLKSEVITALNDMQISSARGPALDALGMSMYGLPRKQANIANTRGELRNVYFYCADDKLFGDINNNQNIVIPQGTIISTIDDFDTREILYKTIEPVTLLSNGGRGYVKVEAVAPGEFYNVEVDSLIFHNFLNYSNSLYKELLVSNRAPIVNGADLETDELYRNRIVNHLRTIGGESAEYYQYQGLRIPGVVDIRVIPSYYGIGTVGIFPITDGLTISTALENSLRANISSSKVAGHTLEVVSPIIVYIDLEATFKVAQGLSNDIKSAIQSTIKQIIFRQLKAQEISSNRLSFGDLESFLKERNNLPRQVLGTSTNVLSSITIRKQSKLTSTQAESSTRYSNTSNYDFDISEVLFFGNITINLVESSQV